MNKEEMEVLDVINSIYYEWSDYPAADEIFNPEVSMNGGCIVVTYLGMTIWSSENDDREFNEAQNRYENIGCFLRKKINKINKNVGAIQIREVADE